MTRKSGKTKHFKIKKSKEFEKDWDLLTSRTQRLTEAERIRYLLAEWKYKLATERERQQLRTRVILDMLIKELEDKGEKHKADLIRNIRPLLIVPVDKELCYTLIDEIIGTNIVDLAWKQAGKCKKL